MTDNYSIADSLTRIALTVGRGGTGEQRDSPSERREIATSLVLFLDTAGNRRCVGQPSGGVDAESYKVIFTMAA
jgi:hypothetical protein